MAFFNVISLPDISVSVRSDLGNGEPIGRLPLFTEKEIKVRAGIRTKLYETFRRKLIRVDFKIVIAFIYKRFNVQNLTKIEPDCSLLFLMVEINGEWLSIVDNLFFNCFCLLKFGFLSLLSHGFQGMDTYV